MAVESQYMPPAPTSAPSEDASNTAPKPLRRACDCCRKRKVKCDGDRPCGPCKKATITCAWDQPAKKKGPKGLRSQRILHMLRKIDGNGSVSPTSPLSPEQNGAFGNWGWNAPNLSPTGTVYNSTTAQHLLPNLVYGPHASVPPDQTYFPSAATSLPQSQHYAASTMPFASNPPSQSWPSQPESLSGISDLPSTLSPAASEPRQRRLPAISFQPYLHLFYSHMFPIMPVIDRRIWLDPGLFADSGLLRPEQYCFLSAISAATIVQLDESIPQPPPLYSNKRMDDLFAEECLRERKRYDYIETPTRLTVMTSFFLFAYYGNHEKHGLAWYYLQESISFCENMNMDDESAYLKLDPVEAQWRRRLYWLLFITERAYAVQIRKHTRLHTNVSLPSVFELEDPTLLNGFVNLAKLFSAIDEKFVQAWRGSRKQSCDEEWLAKTQKQLDDAVLGFDNTTQTQQMDISVTREWLHMLAWQMGVSNGFLWGEEKGEGGMRLDYPIELAKNVVQITSGANALALDSHGIGMEQKLFDIGACLADVLKCKAGDTSASFLEGKEYLNIISQKLSSMRGKESRYLRPLMAKMEGLVGYELNTQTLPLPTETPNSFPPSLSNGYFSTPRLSMVDSMNMLRSLSMTGSLGTPSLTQHPLEDWTQRRESGRVYDELDSEGVDPWLNDVVASQVV